MKKLFAIIGLAVLLCLPAFSQTLPPGIPAGAVALAPAAINYAGPQNPIAHADRQIGDTEIYYGFVATETNTYYLVEQFEDGSFGDPFPIQADAGAGIDDVGIYINADGTFNTELCYYVPNPPAPVEKEKPRRGLIHRAIGTGRLRTH